MGHSVGCFTFKHDYLAGADRQPKATVFQTDLNRPPLEEGIRRRGGQDGSDVVDIT